MREGKERALLYSPLELTRDVVGLGYQQCFRVPVPSWDKDSLDASLGAAEKDPRQGSCIAGTPDKGFWAIHSFIHSF